MKKQIILTLALGTLLACTAQAGQEQLAASIKQAREEAAATSAQLSTTLNALNALVAQKPGDLRPTYECFRAEIPKTQAAAGATSTRVQMMGNQRDKYFSDWQATIGGINNPGLQKKAQKRLDKAAKSYAKVEAAFKTAAEKFRPFLSDLSDVEKALSNDVTIAGVKGMKSVTRKANWDYKFVYNAIEEALKEMKSMESALSGQAG